MISNENQIVIFLKNSAYIIDLILKVGDMHNIKDRN